MSSNADRLARAVIKRRTELDLTQIDVWNSGGPSNTTLTQIENGLQPSLSRTTARKLDEGLHWEAGSARRVWDGLGDPTPIVQFEGVDLEAMLADLLEDTRGLTPDQAEYMVAKLRADIEARKSPGRRHGTA